MSASEPSGLRLPLRSYPSVTPCKLHADSDRCQGRAAGCLTGGLALTSAPIIAALPSQLIEDPWPEYRDELTAMAVGPAERWDAAAGRAFPPGDDCARRLRASPTRSSSTASRRHRGAQLRSVD